MNNTLIFNGKKFSFLPDLLTTLFKCLLHNDTVDDDDEFFVISFITNSIVKKDWDSLDYHEFVLKADFRISYFMRNVKNVFGHDVANKFARVISDFFEESIDTDSTDWFNCISTQTVYKMAKSIFVKNEEIIKFQQFLALLHLYNCAYDDYEQTITDTNGFDGLLNLNGIVIKKSESDKKLLLKPVYSLYDSPLEDYIDLSGFLIPPFVLGAVLNRTYSPPSLEIEETKCSLAEFLLIVEQLSGTRLQLPKPKLDISNWSNDESLYGKWYQINKMDHPVLSLIDISIYDFGTNGILNQSVVFVNSVDYPKNENWRSDPPMWKTKDTQLVIIDRGKISSPLEYKILDNKLFLSNGSVYYRSFQEAKENLG